MFYASEEEPPVAEPTKDTKDLKIKSNPTFIDYYIYTLVLHGLGLLLNSLAIIVFARFKQINQPQKLMITLAISDIIVCLGTPFNIIRGHIAWTYKQFIISCQSFQIYYESATCISVYIYLIITIDRFVALIFPLKYSSIMTRAKFIWYAVILSVHHIGYLIMFYGFINNEEPWVQDYLDSRICKSVNWIHLHGRYYSYAFVFLIVLINLILCVILALKLMARRRKRQALTSARGVDNLSRATTTIVSVCCIYAVLYAQLLTVALVLTGDDSNRAVFIQEVSEYFFYINHFINPIVYYLRMSDFRKGVHELFGRKEVKSQFIMNRQQANKRPELIRCKLPALKTVSETLDASAGSAMPKTTSDGTP